MSTTPEKVYVRPARSIGGLTMDVIVDENHTDDMEITEHPVQQGAKTSDHAYKQPSLVSITGGVSDCGGDEGGYRRSVETYEALLALQAKAEPMDVITGKRSYKNMLIKSLGVTTDEKTENSLMFTAELKQVPMARVQTVAIPRSRQKNGHKTGGVDNMGKQQLEKVKIKNKSAAKTLFGW